MIKEIRVKPLEADNKEGKIMAYIFFFQPDRRRTPEHFKTKEQE